MTIFICYYFYLYFKKNYSHAIFCKCVCCFRHDFKLLAQIVSKFYQKLSIILLLFFCFKKTRLLQVTIELQSCISYYKHRWKNKLIILFISSSINLYSLMLTPKFAVYLQQSSKLKKGQFFYLLLHQEQSHNNYIKTKPVNIQRNLVI